MRVWDLVVYRHRGYLQDLTIGSTKIGSNFALSGLFQKGLFGGSFEQNHLAFFRG
jgi:hypothetical protein